ncbi:NAD-dependent epimerase/dehydratase family protein [Luteimicrobium subarcticum]|uniref:Nucleoside-diphosphate-sugar epimerase n=1 Tax=Luteimicrobium subarcticum TaxID=620910 RepID=A0A2M8WRJ5_9MICO|nr:NAD-dependent epimerase/dehydratase family protein [Luteimicrobium subarcticum]PJI93524.1 nucleoside-diphosphate-sugar epimerase [Luteimicrobium subarcticum]
MRVAVVGASGNSGSALLGALAAEPSVTDVVGIARRRPDTSSPPFDGARWVTADVGEATTSPVEEDGLVDRLAGALDGVDAVVHLAWAIQPNRDRDLLRRTNVDGTRRVGQAAARAGARHLVVASSVGAYSPVADDTPRDESWPTGGVPTSHYSVDKAAQERVLDGLEREHDDLVVTRLRPSLIFQPGAGAEIDRYFLGPLVPRGLVRPGVLPVVPLPAGLRLQATHADDVARAYVAAIVRGAAARGAFNVAAAPVLDGRAVAEVLDHGHVLNLPPGLVRRVLALAWSAHAVRADAGWLDMAMGAPVMDTSRARDVLGWAPRHDAVEALRGVLEGLAAGRGRRSDPLDPA